MARYLYSELASTLQAIRNLTAKDSHSSHNSEWITKHENTIDSLCKQHLPAGSGFDSGSHFDVDASHAEKLVFTTSFHHMDDGGYTGWTEHVVTVTPSFTGINIRISGRNRNDIKDAIHEAFDLALKTDVTYDLYLPHYPQFAITSKWEEKDGSPSQCTQSYFVGGVRFMYYAVARETAASLMVEASRKR